jgi:hypothetical protein
VVRHGVTATGGADVSDSTALLLGWLELVVLLAVLAVLVLRPRR